jgi:hypothetical protein
MTIAGGNMKACIVEFSPEVLRALLKLPEGALITSVEQPTDRVGVLRMRVEGIGWDVPEGGCIPSTRPLIRSVTLDDGRTFVESVEWGTP